MYITITSIRLKSWWRFFQLSYYGLKISRQAKNERGFVQQKSTGFGYLHYTLSAWDSEEDLKRFYRTGAHLEAMKKASIIATETQTYTYVGSSMPSWTEAKRVLFEKGKVMAWD